MRKKKKLKWLKPSLHLLTAGIDAQLDCAAGSTAGSLCSSGASPGGDCLTGGAPSCSFYY